MPRPALLFLPIFIVSCLAPPPPFEDKCLIGEPLLYENSKSLAVPWFDVDLDQPASDRWRHIAMQYKQQIQDLIQATRRYLILMFGQKFVKFTEWSLGELDSRFPAPYADELKGIANAANLTLGDLVLYNIFYDIFSVCTSIVAQDPNGKLYHARNMDFGFLMGWNGTSHDWVVTEKLRRAVFNVNFKRNGSTLYQAATFAGYIGIFNAMKRNSFTVTINERFIMNGGYRGIIDWLLERNNASWMSWAIRETFETIDNFDDAVHRLMNVEVVAPMYVIISGTKPGQGQIIVRSRNKTDGVVKLNPESSDDGWFLLQTNTDPWNTPFFLDDRRTPGRHCMKKMTRQTLSLPKLFQVLSSPTTLNKLTAYSVLVDTVKGKFETYIQKCPDPCWFW